MSKSDLSARAKAYVDTAFAGDGAPKPFDPGSGNHVANPPRVLEKTIQKARGEVTTLKKGAARISDFDPDNPIGATGIMKDTGIFSGSVGGPIRYSDAAGHEHCCEPTEFGKMKGHYLKHVVKPAEAKTNALDAAYEELKGLGKEASAILKTLQKVVVAGARQKKKGDERKAESLKKSAEGAVKKLKALEARHGKIIKETEKKAIELDKALVATRARRKSEGKIKLA